jgi:hypothetical protein
MDNEDDVEIDKEEEDDDEVGEEDERGDFDESKGIVVSLKLPLLLPRLKASRGPFLFDFLPGNISFSKFEKIFLFS